MQQPQSALAGTQCAGRLCAGARPSPAPALGPTPPPAPPQSNGNPIRVQEAKDMCVLYDSLQVRYHSAVHAGRLLGAGAVGGRTRVRTAYDSMQVRSC